MKFRRDLIIVALATFCLTSTLFMVVTSRSADSPNWDPWADIKEDGTVDIYDAITLSNAFGSSGETPKNVSVTNWPSNTYPKDSIFTWYSSQYIPPTASWGSDHFSTVGFTQVTVRIVTNATISAYYYQNLYVGLSATTMEYDYRIVTLELTKTFNVKGTEFYVWLWNSGSETAQISCYIYMNSIPRIDTKPSFDEQSVNLNASQGVSQSYFDCEGFSRLSVTVAPGYQARNGTYDVTLYVYAIGWGGAWEYLPTSALNVTFTVTNGVVDYDHPRPLVLETKARGCTLFWSVLNSHNLPPDWWLTFTVYGYLRNE